MQKNILVVLVTLFIPLCVWASSEIGQTTSPKIRSSKIPGIAYEKECCPVEASLTLSQDLWWTAPGGWKSDSQSFVSEIDHFIGAQWTGINVGKIICLYKGKGKENFPVALIRETLAPEPSGELWGPNQQAQRTCESEEVTDCSFLSEKNKKTTPDVYKQLDFFKNNQDTTDDKQ